MRSAAGSAASAPLAPSRRAAASSRPLPAVAGWVAAGCPARTEVARSREHLEVALDGARLVELGGGDEQRIRELGEEPAEGQPRENAALQHERLRLLGGVGRVDDELPEKRGFERQAVALAF